MDLSVFFPLFPYNKVTYFFLSYIILPLLSKRNQVFSHKNNVKVA